MNSFLEERPIFFHIFPFLCRIQQISEALPAERRLEMSCKNHKLYNTMNVDHIQFSATGIRCYACWFAVTLPWLSHGC